MSRIYLRALEPEDYTITIKWRNDEEITKALSGNRFFVSQAREKQWVLTKSTDESEGIYLAICLKESDLCIGFLSLVNIDLRNRKADIGGWIIGDKELWNQGYSKEAVRLLIDYAFNEYPINKLTSSCLEEHEISRKTHISLGFSFDGVLRNDVYKDGEFKSILLFSILKEEYVMKYPKDKKQYLKMYESTGFKDD